jgi:hypothetical protein
MRIAGVRGVGAVLGVVFVGTVHSGQIDVLAVRHQNDVPGVDLVDETIQNSGGHGQIAFLFVQIMIVSVGQTLREPLARQAVKIADRRPTDGHNAFAQKNAQTINEIWFGSYHP